MEKLTARRENYNNFENILLLKTLNVGQFIDHLSAFSFFVEVCEKVDN
jgi:hypothetical protein